MDIGSYYLTGDIHHLFDDLGLKVDKLYTETTKREAGAKQSIFIFLGFITQFSQFKSLKFDRYVAHTKNGPSCFEQGSLDYQHERKISLFFLTRLLQSDKTSKWNVPDISR